MIPCDVIIVEKERWTRRPGQGVFLIIVDLSNTTILFITYA